jgi:hypothetical protein
MNLPAASGRDIILRVINLINTFKKSLIAVKYQWNIVIFH